MRSEVELKALHHVLQKRAYEVLRPLIPALVTASAPSSKVASSDFSQVLKLHQQRP